MIHFAGVSKRLPNGAWAVRGVSLQIARGELVYVIGESGSGKSTLVKLVNRLVEADEGTVSVDGVNVRAIDAVALRRTIGYVIQHVGLLPHLRVDENIAIVPKLLGWAPAPTAARVDELLELVGLADARDRYPDQLSGGQQQRVGLARALAARPKLMLLDEPFGALDAITRTALQRELRELHDELQLTTIVVTHDLVEALTLADRIAIMYRGELHQTGTPAELLAHPADDYVAALMHMVRHEADQLERLMCAS